MTSTEPISNIPLIDVEISVKRLSEVALAQCKFVKTRQQKLYAQ